MTASFTFEMPPPLRRDVEREANRDRVSLGAMVRALVREGLDARAREAEKVRREFELKAQWPVNA